MPSTSPLDNPETEYPLTEKGEVAQVIGVLSTLDSEKENERINDSKEDKDIIENNISANPEKSSDAESTYEYVAKGNEN